MTNLRKRIKQILETSEAALVASDLDIVALGDEIEQGIRGSSEISAGSPDAYVREFHETYGHAIRDTPTLDVPERALRVDLLWEEVEEYTEAETVGDLTEMADALADIVYVAYGAALVHGIPLDAVLAEVHRANMSKLGDDGKPVYREDGKVLKGPGYSPPDVAGVLRGRAPEDLRSAEPIGVDRMRVTRLDPEGNPVGDPFEFPGVRWLVR